MALWMVGWQVAWLIGWLLGWRVGWGVIWLIGWPVGLLTDRSAVCWVHWLVDSLSGLLVGRLVG